MEARNNVSIIVKTFEREENLKNLLDSIQKTIPESIVIVCDDSREPYAPRICKLYEHLSISCITLPYDSGLSCGRNALLGAAKTDYIVLCDDDFIFDARTNIPKALELMLNKDVDILGGALYNIKSFFKKRGVYYSMVGYFEDENEYIKTRIKNNCRSKFVRCDLVQNFFIAKRLVLLENNGWNPSLKLAEHGEFFYRMKNSGVRVAFSSAWGAVHNHIGNENYDSFRKRDYEGAALRAIGVNKWVDYMENGSTFIRMIDEDGKASVKEEFHHNLMGVIKKVSRLLK